MDSSQIDCVGFGLQAVSLYVGSGLRITHISKIGKKVRTRRVPAQLCSGLRTGRLGVPPGEEPEEAEMLLGLFR